MRAVAERDPQRVITESFDRVGSDVETNRDAQTADHLAQQRTTGGVELLTHQARCPLNDVRLQPELAQGIRGLEAEETAADHDSGPAARRRGTRGVGADGVEVVHGPVHVAARQIVPRHGGHEGVGPRGEHQRVVGDPTTQRRRDMPGGPVDPGDPIPQDQLDEVVAQIPIARQRKSGAIPMLGVAGEPDAVIGGVVLLGEHGDAPFARPVTGTQRLHESVADHAVADQDDGLRRTHDRRLGTRYCRHVASCEAPITVCSPAVQPDCEQRQTCPALVGVVVLYGLEVVVDVVGVSVSGPESSVGAGVAGPGAGASGSLVCTVGTV